MTDAALMDGFLTFSSEVTAFSVFELRGTGEAEAYLDAAEGVVGEAVLNDLFAAHGKVTGAGEEREGQIRREILGDPRLGPVARNIIKMWFAGIWYQLPQAWISAYGPVKNDETFTVRPSSYTEGLLWKTIGANPPGAKSPGYGSWAEPPRIPDPDQGFPLGEARS